MNNSIGFARLMWMGPWPGLHSRQSYSRISTEIENLDSFGWSAPSYESHEPPKTADHMHTSVTFCLWRNFFWTFQLWKHHHMLSAAEWVGATTTVPHLVFSLGGIQQPVHKCKQTQVLKGPPRIQIFWPINSLTFSVKQQPGQHV